MPFDAFISYSSRDKITADTVCAGLESAGIRCWIAPRDIRAGTEYAAGIIDGIDGCRIMVLIFSSSANASPQIHREIERAVSKGLTIVPFRIEDIAPTKAMEYYLGSIHWLDALTPPLAEHIRQLVAQIRANLQVDVAGVAAPASLFADAPVAAAAAKSVGAAVRPASRNIILLTLIGAIAVLSAVALFWWSQTIVITKTAGFGGSGGVGFDDLDSNQRRLPVSALAIIVNLNPQQTTQRVIGGVQTQWGAQVGPLHGGLGPNAQPATAIKFADGEKIGRVDVSSGNYTYKTSDNVQPHWVSGIQIWTNQRVYAVGDPTFGHTSQCILAQDEFLVGFFGRSGSFIDQIGCIVGKHRKLL
jgi:TIR domain/Jacalin-like lectin domain